MKNTLAQNADDFFSDLVDYETAAPLLNMRAKSIPVAICKGDLPLTRYKRGRKAYLSKTEIAELIRRRARPAPVTGEQA